MGKDAAEHIKPAGQPRYVVDASAGTHTRLLMLNEATGAYERYGILDGNDQKAIEDAHDICAFLSGRP